MSKDAELRLRAEIIRELKAEVKRLREEVGFWAGEGQQLRPEMAEYRKLVTENTTQAKARVRELAEMFRIEVEDAPELRERLTELRTENERLRKVMEQAAKTVEACGHTDTCDCCWCKMRKLLTTEAEREAGDD